MTSLKITINVRLFSSRSMVRRIPPSRWTSCTTKSQSSVSKTSDKMAENIFLFVPNLIGYGRIILALISLCFMRTDYVTATLCYLLSAFLDHLDGPAARKLNQETKFGAMLDQLTDRCATMCLLVTLSALYPDYMLYFQLGMTIDIASHWLYLHSCSIQGNGSHKLIDLSANPILYVYYSEPTLSVMCAGNDLFYSMLYLLHFTEGPLIPIVSVSVFRLILLISAPVALAKIVISIVHLITASKNMAIIDTNEREQRAKSQKD